MTRLVLVCMVGHTPLRPSRPVHCPPSIGPCSKIVGSNPCDSSQRASTSPPGPAPITATFPVIGELSHGSEPAAISLMGVGPRVMRARGNSAVDLSRRGRSAEQRTVSTPLNIRPRAVPVSACACVRDAVVSSRASTACGPYQRPGRNRPTTQDGERIGVDIAGAGFVELRGLCTLAGDNAPDRTARARLSTRSFGMSGLPRSN